MLARGHTKCPANQEPTLPKVASKAHMCSCMYSIIQRLLIVCCVNNPQELQGAGWESRFGQCHYGAHIGILWIPMSAPLELHAEDASAAKISRLPAIADLAACRC